ncbi:MAG: SMC-Scp complex subunit ScpB [Patescibacteria group bacterium]|jgi:segregation and condensation protein B
MKLESILESLLFISNQPLSLKELAKAADVSVGDVKDALTKIGAEYQESGRGFILAHNNDKYQLTTAPENAEIVSRFLKDETSGELTPASLEALTIIAYRGPVTKTELEMIRGINCSLILRNLLIRGLIEETEDKILGETVYSVSLDFLKYLGVANLNELPDYEKLHARQPLTSAVTEADADPTLEIKTN